MARKKKKAEETGTIDLTPMLDVVFIMLIFFIVTASFIKETGVEVNRPDAITSIPKKANILIAINSNNEIWIDKRQIDPRAVKVNVERMYAENPKGGIIIQADDEANIETMTLVADMAREVGISKVSIATGKK